MSNFVGSPKLRRDLVHCTIEMGRDPVWVTKDPLSNQYLHFSESEHDLLMLASGERSIVDIAEVMQSRSPTTQIEASSIGNFFSEAAQRGLLASHAPTQASVQTSAAKKIQWRSLLFLRLPGFQPSGLLTFLSPVADWLFSSWLFRSALIIAPLCALAVFMNFDRFATDLSSMVQVGNPGSLVAIIVAVSVAKIIHELAHALACRHFDCECREMGVMLLLGIPCLYVDVSDAWMLKSKRQRMMISAAGMYAEVLIAIAATAVWLASNPGSVHDIAAMLMIVCSVSTVLINSNPLLRYDGYYLLSDAVGVPNLASRSRASLTRTVGSMFGKPNLNPEPGWMSVYAVASLVYRGVIWLTITLVAVRFLQDRGLDLLAQLMLAGILVWWVLTKARSIEAGLGPAKGWKLPRTMTAITVLAVLSMLPLPKHIVAPMTVIPADAKAIYTSESGFLISETAPGTHVASTQTLVRLRNPATTRQQSRAVANQRSAKARLNTLRRSRVGQTAWAAQIPAAEKDLERAEASLAIHSRNLSDLTINSPVSGTLFSDAGTIPSNQKQREDGSWLPAGTTIGVLGDDHLREAMIYLSDHQVSQTEVGHDVILLITELAKGKVRGKIVAIDSVPCENIPASLNRFGLSNPNGSPERSNHYYRARVKLDASGNDLIVHRTGRASVDVASESLAVHVYRLLSETFR